VLKLTSQKPTKYISQQTNWKVLLKTWLKHEPYQGIETARKVQLIIEIKTCSRVDKLPPSSFMWAIISFSNKL
jgi:hypothetical protein